MTHIYIYIPEGFNRKQQDEQDVSWVMWQQQRSEAKARSWWSSKSIGTKLYAEASWFNARLPRGPGNGFHVGREWHIEVVFREKVELLRFWIQWKLQTSAAMQQCDSQDQIEFRERLTCRTWWFSQVSSFFPEVFKPEHGTQVYSGCLSPLCQYRKCWGQQSAEKKKQGLRADVSKTLLV